MKNKKSITTILIAILKSIITLIIADILAFTLLIFCGVPIELFERELLFFIEFFIMIDVALTPIFFLFYLK